MSSRDPSVNITYGIMTILYLITVVVLNTLNIRLYEQEVLIPLQQGPEKAPAPVQQQQVQFTVKVASTENILLEEIVVNNEATGSFWLDPTIDNYNIGTADGNTAGGYLILLKDQVDKTQNGIYYRNMATQSTGDGSSGDGKMQVRKSATSTQPSDGELILVENGTVNKGKTFKKNGNNYTNIENFTNIEAFGNVPETKLETTSVRTTKINKEAIAITESILMGLTLPLAFGYIIGFDCSCPPNDAHVGKIIFCLGVFIPMIFIIVNEIINLLFPDIDILNPFLPPGSDDKEGKIHFFNKQYRKTICWCIVTFTFIIHFFSVAFGQQSGRGSVDII